MKYYDVTQEVFSSKVYPGDPAPEREKVLGIDRGDNCNLTSFRMCAHNGTHMDAPRHFIEDGRSIEAVEPAQFMGMCSVITFDGRIDEDTARRIINGREKKILWKGNAEITVEAARVFVEKGLELVGVESQTVGAGETIGDVHRILLGTDMVIIEGLVMDEVEEGAYFLCAMPLKLAGSDGAPCRVVLMRKE